MKKILALILVCFLAVSFVACGGGADESSSAFQTSSTADTSDVESSAAESSKDSTTSEDASTATSEDASTTTSEGETSEEVSGETSEGETSTEDEDKVTFTNKYVSWSVATGNGARVSLRATDATSLQISKFDEILVAGDVGVYTTEFGKTIKGFSSDVADFAVVVAEYDHETFSYVRKSFDAVGEADESTKIPEDGFVIVIHKDYADKISAISTTANPLFPHGFVANTGLDAKIKAAKSAPTIDGKVDSKEYGSLIWDVTPDNKLVSYAQFEKNNYFATAQVYMTYDADYLYLGVVVDSPIHDNDLGASNAGDMYNQTSIQVNFGANGRETDYIDENWDWAVNQTSTNDNLMRQYGFALNPESGELLTTVWQGNKEKVCDTFCVTREGEITTYEVALAWSDLGSDDEPFAPEKGDKIQLSVSFNLGGKTVGQFKNVTLRDGGGIIGINDWSKIPTITLN